jgi:hypothetical protein
MVMNESIEESIGGTIESVATDVEAPGILTSGFERDEEMNSFSIDDAGASEMPAMSLNGVGANAEQAAQEPEPVSSSDDDFGGDISFESDLSPKTSGFNEIDDINTPDDDHGFSDVLIDVWSDETKAQKSEEGEFGGFEDSEIARLFPNE